MAGEIKVYSLGDKGVNVSNDLLHTDIADVTQAQNAAFYGSGKRGGLSKRLGMRPINAVALAGAVLSVLSVTFADPSPDTFITDMDLVTLTDDSFLPLAE